MNAQSRRMSLTESVANVAIGLGVATAANLVVLPLFGLAVSLAQAGGIGLVMTIISIARSYVVRRAFERMRVAAHKRDRAAAGGVG